MTLQKESMILPMKEIEFKPSDQRKLRALISIIPMINYLIGPEKRRSITERLEQDKNFCNTLGAVYSLVAEVIKESSSTQELKNKVSEKKKQLETRYRKNMNGIYHQLVPTKKAVESLKLCFSNAKGNPNIFLFKIDKELFLESPDPQHWDQLVDVIEQKFYAWNMLDTPCYFSFCFEVNKPNTATSLSQFFSEMLAMGVIDIPVFNSANDTIDFMDNSFSIVAPDSDRAHLMISGTHGFVEGVYEDFDETKKVPVPLGPALVGKLLSIPLGAFFTSLKGSPINGIESVVCKYPSARKNAAEFSKRGLIQIIKTGNIQGTSTCYNGSIDEFKSFMTMDIYCLVSRALLQEGNNLANGKWGKKQQDDLIEGLVTYFNKLKTEGVIEDYVLGESIVVNYDKSEKTVSISIPIKYAGVAEKFVFTLQGEQDDLKFGTS